MPKQVLEFDPRAVGNPLHTAVMPLIAKSDSRIVGLGTGFLISPIGLMMTAVHVIREATRLYDPTYRDDTQGVYRHGKLFAV